MAVRFEVMSVGGAYQHRQKVSSAHVLGSSSSIVVLSVLSLIYI